MKMIILSAGKGSRMMPLTQNLPKPLLYFKNGKTVLETQLDRIKQSGVIDEVVIVIGFCGEQIEAKLKTYDKGNLKIKTIYNPFYDVSNNLCSLWLARHEMNEDFIITNGDNILDASVYEDIAQNAPKGIVLTINKKDKYTDDDMKVLLEDGVVSKVSKLINGNEASAESVGLVKVSGKNSIEVFKNTMDELVRDQSYVDKFWLEIFNRLSQKCIPVTSFEIDGTNKWQEIDFHPDLEMAKKLLGL